MKVTKKIKLNDVDTFRFIDKMVVNKQTKCWEWIGAKNDLGYGYFWLDNVAGVVRAHRLAWVMANGNPNGKLELDHLCRNKACVNPKHLEQVSASENQIRNVPFRKKRSKLVVL